MKNVKFAHSESKQLHDVFLRLSQSNLQMLFYLTRFIRHSRNSSVYKVSLSCTDLWQIVPCAVLNKHDHLTIGSCPLYPSLRCLLCIKLFHSPSKTFALPENLYVTFSIQKTFFFQFQGTLLHFA